MNTSITRTGRASTQRLWAARVILAIAVAVTIALIAAATGPRRTNAGEFPFEHEFDRIEILAEHDIWDDPLAPEVNLLDRYDLVRDVLLNQGGVAIRVPWVQDINGFRLGEGPKLYVDNDKDSLAFYGRAATLAPMGEDNQSIEVLLTADWDESNPNDSDPRLVLAVKAHNVQLEDFGAFGEIAAGLSLELADGWVVFTDENGELDLSDLPSTVVTPFFQPLQDDELLAGGQPFNLTQGANFMADLALNQMPALDRAISLAGVDAVHLRVHGKLATDASVLFDEASLDELAVFDVTGTLDATGANPPAWLEDRAFSIRVKSSDDLVPEIDLTDTITTLVGDATNVFENGFRFDPLNFGAGDIPINLKFDLLGTFAEPFGIDVPTLLEDALPGGFDITLALSGTVDLSDPDVLSSLQVALEFTDSAALGGPATLKIGLTIDPVTQVTVATFSADLDLSLDELNNALRGAFGLPATTLGDVGALTLDHFGAEVKRVQLATSISVEASIGAYDNVLGFDWIDLDDLTVALELSNDGQNGAVLAAPTFHGRLSADIEIDGVAWTVQIEIDANAEGFDVRVSLLLGDGESLTLGGLATFLQGQGAVAGIDAGALLNALQLDDLRVTLRAGTSGTGIDVLAQVVVPDLFGDIEIDATLFMSVFADDDGPTFFVGVRPTDPISFGTFLPIPTLNTINLPNLALIMTNTTEYHVGVPAKDLTPEAFEFLKGVHGCAPDKKQPTTVGLDQPPGFCHFNVRLDPGINFVSNIQLPAELAPITEALWIDPTQGIQFVGTISIPVPGMEGFNNGGAVNLLMNLPAVNPPDAVDFIEQGQLSLQLTATAENPSVKLELIGQLDVRLRRSNDVVTTCEFGVPLPGFDKVDDQLVGPTTYCYDRLRLEVSAEVALTATSVQMTLGGALVSLDPLGWRSPFGLEWLTIGEIRGELGVELTLPSDLKLKLGVLGDISVAGKQFKGSLSVGMKVTPAPTPAGVAVVPEFYGARGFVSSLGSTDLVRLADALAGAADLDIPLDGIPLFEVRNFEFMVSLVDDDDLCLEPGIGVAGELFFVDNLTEGVAEMPPTPPGECAPFGGRIDPDRCASETGPGSRADGCFSSFFGLIDFNGIRINGTVGPIDLGPVHFDDAELKIILTLQQQTFVVRGGIGVDVLGSGEVAILVEPTRLQLFGHVDAFDVFMAELEANMSVGLGSDFGIDFEADFRGALQADFDDALEGLIDDALDVLGQKVDAIKAKLEAVKNAKPSDFTAAIVSLMNEVDQATGFGFFDEIEDAIEAFGDAADDVTAGLDDIGDIEIDPITVKELLDGGTGSLDFSVPFTCFFDEYNSSTGKCVPGGDAEPYTPSFVCPIGDGSFGRHDGAFQARCLVEFEIPNFEGLSYSGVIAEITERATAGLENVLYKLESFTSGLSIDAILDRLDGFDASQAFDLQCANFEFGSTATNSKVAMTLKATILGKTLGWDIDLDPKHLDAEEITEMVDLLVKQLLSSPAEIECTEHLTAPQGLTDVSFLDGYMSLTDDSLVEGDIAHLRGGITGGDAGDAEIQIDWGDGRTETIDLARGALINEFHTYRDDPPGSISQYTIRLLIDGDERETTTVTVVNALPVAFVELTDSSIDEGDTVSVDVDYTDAGSLDTHRIIVDWGDGAVETFPATGDPPLPPSAGPQTLSHTYVDDDPTDTASDEFDVQVRVVDKDGGTDTDSLTLTVNNVDPVVEIEADASVNEAQLFSIDVSWSDPGADDEHTVLVVWGDGLTSSVTPDVGERSVTLSHTYTDDDPTNSAHDPYDIDVTVTDDDTGEGDTTHDIEVYNVDPVVFSVTLSATTINENTSVMVSGSFTDPGLLDSHTIRIDWGDDALPDTVIEPAVGVRTYSASKTYGDNSGSSPFVITVSVTDDDTGSGSETANLTVSNVQPTPTISTTGSRVIGGLDTFIIGTGDPLSVGGTVTDPGSDDLFVTWDYDTLVASVDAQGSSPVPGQTGPDELPSPEVRPRTGTSAMTDNRTTSYATACRYDLGLAVRDDDMATGAFVTDSAVVIVVGDETIRRSAGYWTQQYGNKPLISAALRFCYLRMVDHLSAVFGDTNPLLVANDQNASVANALNIVDGSKARTMTQKFDRQLLTAWLAIANGSIGYDEMVDTDGNGTLDKKMGQWLNELEAARNGTPTDANLKLWAGQLEKFFK